MIKSSDVVAGECFFDEYGQVIRRIIMTNELSASYELWRRIARGNEFKKISEHSKYISTFTGLDHVKTHCFINADNNLEML